MALERILNFFFVFTKMSGRKRNLSTILRAGVLLIIF